MSSLLLNKEQVAELQSLLSSHRYNIEEMAKELFALSSHNTHSKNKEGLLSFADMWIKSLALLDATMQQEFVSEETGPLIIVSKRPSAPKHVILSGHYDTVFPATTSFQPSLETPTLIKGPGVSDMKGGLLIMKEALLLFESLPEHFRSQVGWTMLLTPDEEIGSVFSEMVIPNIIKKFLDKEAVGIVFEPTLPNGAHIDERPASLTITLTSNGRAAHAGRDFFEGRNAITALVAILSAIEQAIPQKDPLINIALFEGGRAANIVPDIAQSVINIRSFSQKKIDDAMIKIREILSLKSREGITTQLSIQRSRPPKEKTRDVIEAIKLYSETMHLLFPESSTSWGHSGGLSDANLLQSYGLACLDGMGVIGGGLHTEDEWCQVASIPERAQKIAGFLALLSQSPEAKLPHLRRTP